MKITSFLKMSKVNNKGLATVFIRITNGTTEVVRSLKMQVKPANWDSKSEKFKSSHPNSARENALLLTKKEKISKIIASLELSGKTISKGLIIDSIDSDRVGVEFDFFKYSIEYENYVKLNNRYSTYKRIKSIILKLKTFNKSSRLLISDFNLSYINKYERYLLEDLKNSHATVAANFKVIKTIINKAIFEGYLNPAENPFLRKKFKSQNFSRDYLSKAEFDRLCNLELDENHALKQIHDIYLFQVYSGGIRISDVLKMRFKNIKEGRISFETLKTKTGINLPMNSKAIIIVNRYKIMASKHKGDIENRFIFPIMITNPIASTNQDIYNGISNATVKINLGLKTLAKLAKIDKRLTTHTARHTYATLTLSHGISLSSVSAILGHKKLKETEIYAKVLREDIDRDIMKIESFL